MQQTEKNKPTSKKKYIEIAKVTVSMSFWFVRLFSFVKNILFAYILAGSIVYLFHILYLKQRNMILPNGEISTVSVSGQKVTLPEFWDIWVTNPSSITLIPLLEKSIPTKSFHDQSSPQHLNLKILKNSQFLVQIKLLSNIEILGLESRPQSWKVPNDLQRNTV